MLFKTRRLDVFLLAFSAIIALVPAATCKATIYHIDPSSNHSNADGSLGKPFKSWNDVTWAAGNQYLQKTGTVFADTLWLTDPPSGTNSQPIIMGSYGAGPKPVIRATPNANYAFTLRNASHWIVRDLKFEGAKGPQIFVYASTSNMFDLTFEHLECDGGSLNHSGGFQNGMRFATSNPSRHIDTVKIQFCYIHDAGGTSSGNHDGINAWAIRSRATIRGNLITNSGGDGIDLAGGSFHQIKRNVIVGTRKYNGIKVHGQQYPLYNSLIFHNVVYDAHDFGLLLLDADRTKVFNNTLHSQPGTWPGGIMMGNHAGNKSKIKYAQVWNNILNGGRDQRGSLYVDSIPDFWTVTLKNNCYWPKSGNTTLIKFNNTDHSDITSANFDNSWRDAHLALYTNPLHFADTLLLDFSLHVDSPCRDTGTSSPPGADWDIVYNPVDDSPDIGAFEFQ